jgi:hypothetical protein
MKTNKIGIKDSAGKSWFVDENKLIGYIKDWHENCEQSEMSGCEINDAINNNVPNEELIDVFLDVDDVDDFIDSECKIDWNAKSNWGKIAVN